MADKTRKRLGDRKEGRRLRTISPIIGFTPYIMRDRSDACNMFSGSVDITETDRWLREQRRAGWKGLGMLHMFIAAYIRVVSHMPGLNRFVAGQRVYARNDITVNMMVKRSVDLESEETVAKVVFEPTDTVYDVYRKMNEIPYEWGTAVNVQQMRRYAPRTTAAPSPWPGRCSGCRACCSSSPSG